MGLTTDRDARKASPIFEGCLAYFPNAVAAVAALSKAGNDFHNPGQPLHWAFEKSSDHADCIARHLIDSGTFDKDGQRHSAKVAWRALALLETELVREGASPGKNVKRDEPTGTLGDEFAAMSQWSGTVTLDLTPESIAALDEWHALTEQFHRENPSGLFLDGVQVGTVSHIDENGLIHGVLFADDEVAGEVETVEMVEVQSTAKGWLVAVNGGIKFEYESPNDAYDAFNYYAKHEGQAMPPPFDPSKRHPMHAEQIRAEEERLIRN